MNFAALRDRLNTLDAKTWKAIRDAARAGDPEAQYLLGHRRNWANLGTEKNCEKWLTAAADQGHLQAMYELSGYLRGPGRGDATVEKGLNLLVRCAELGLAEAQRDLAVQFVHGKPPFEEDWSKVRYWYGKAAAQGHQEAKVALGSMMIEGEGGPVDQARGLALLEEAAEGSEAMWTEAAARQLAKYYGGSHGVPQDREKAAQWKSKYSDPRDIPEQVFNAGKTRFVVRTFIQDPYQKELLASGWLKTLTEELSTYPELGDKAIRLVVRPSFHRLTLESDSGRQAGSMCDKENPKKNRFLLEASWILPSGSPMEVTYSYEIYYRPFVPSFQLLDCEAAYEWNTPPEDLGLEAKLIELGVLKEFDLGKERPNEKLASITMRGSDDLPSLVPVHLRKHVVTIAIDSVETFPRDLTSAWGWGLSRKILEPALVRDRESLSAFRQRLYGGLVVKKYARLEGFRASGRLKEIFTEEVDTATRELKSKDHLIVRYHNSWSGRFEVLFGPELTILDSNLTCVDFDYPGCKGVLIGKTLPGTWRELLEATKEEEVWSPRPERQAIDGSAWTLEKVGENARRVRASNPYACPYLEFCLRLLEAAGLELNVQRLVSWDRPGEGW